MHSGEESQEPHKIYRVAVSKIKTSHKDRHPPRETSFRACSHPLKCWAWIGSLCPPERAVPCGRASGPRLGTCYVSALGTGFENPGIVARCIEKVCARRREGKGRTLIRLAVAT